MEKRGRVKVCPAKFACAKKLQKRRDAFATSAVN